MERNLTEEKNVGAPQYEDTQTTRLLNCLIRDLAVPAHPQRMNSNDAL